MKNFGRFYLICEFIYLDLTKDVVKFGRKGVDICVADLGVFPEKKIGEVSNIHFTLRKNNVHEAFCPVFLEVSAFNVDFIVQFFCIQLKIFSKCYFPRIHRPMGRTS